MAKVDGKDYPEHLYYDLANQIWYEPLDDGTIRAGFTPIAIALAGEVLVFAPKRVGKTFEAQRSFAIIECGKWVGAARAAFNGTVVAPNVNLEQMPGLLNDDAFGSGWIAHAKTNPGAVTYGTPGPGTNVHLGMERVQRHAGIKLTHVPYAGAVSLIPAVLGGHVMLQASGMEWKPSVDA
jgi:glycine cleavage system H protein